MRVAVIGAGPSGFFVAGEILKRCPGCEVHLFEKRVAPYGLVRYGVTPDHQPTRRAIKLFDQIADQGRFHYYGNVEIGRDIPLPRLLASHHAVVVCTGAERPNRPDIPGARLRGAVDALDLARWANGEPEAFDARLLEGVESVLVIGNGNVALDAARLFMRPSVDWVATDIAPYAMEALIHHRVREVVVAGRRSAAEVSFSEAEWQEVVGMPGWSVAADGEVPFGPVPEKPMADKRLQFSYQLSPAGLLGEDSVAGGRFSHGTSRSTVDIAAQLVVFATGHRGIPLDGLPFDAERGVIPHERGAVTGCPGMYVCGWIKRGAKGLIGFNRKDAIETATRLIEDIDVLAERQPESVDWRNVLIAGGLRAVSWSDWKSLDAMEIQRGSAVGRPRVHLMPSEALSLLAASDQSKARES